MLAVTLYSACVLFGWRKIRFNYNYWQYSRHFICVDEVHCCANNDAAAHNEILSKRQYFKIKPPINACEFNLSRFRRVLIKHYENPKKPCVIKMKFTHFDVEEGFPSKERPTSALFPVRLVPGPIVKKKRYASRECPLGESESKRLIKRRPWHERYSRRWKPEEVRTLQPTANPRRQYTDHKVSHWIAVSQPKVYKRPSKRIICTRRRYYGPIDYAIQISMSNNKEHAFFSFRKSASLSHPTQFQPP